ncbi:MAG: metallophosphoesterase [Crocinitomicaceae bacterium]|nr:metallophosphoesterase [Crocinitomicaceae bacterium]
MDADQDSIVNSFVFVGCNRLWWKDVQPNTSSANVSVLTNIFNHVAQSDIKTDYFFFLGDIVNGEATNEVLESQLKNWTTDYENGVFSDFKSTGIELVAVPGNHEMLNQAETPLAGTTDTWMKYMTKYMPEDRDSIPNSPDDRMTYGFTDGNIAYVVLNTDTYNTTDGTGIESVIPYDWVKKQVAIYKADPAIDHVFVMGHRPFYTNCLDSGDTLLCPEDNAHECIGNTTHSGVRYPEKSNPVWQSFEDNNVISMLSAHVHQYQRLQPNQKTYQLVAGNGGSPLHHKTPPKFFGYTRINIWASGRVEMISEGYDAPFPYDRPIDPLTNKDTTWTVRDSLYDMNWYKKGAKNAATCECVTEE